MRDLPARAQLRGSPWHAAARAKPPLPKGDKVSFTLPKQPTVGATLTATGGGSGATREHSLNTTKESALGDALGGLPAAPVLLDDDDCHLRLTITPSLIQT